jgi:hypothetical protein
MAATKERLMATYYLLNLTSGDHYLQPTKTEIVWPGTQFVLSVRNQFCHCSLSVQKVRKKDIPP